MQPLLFHRRDNNMPGEIPKGHELQKRRHDQDPSLAPITLVEAGMRLETSAILSNSFAFGGNNVSLIFGYTHFGYTHE